MRLGKVKPLQPQGRGGPFLLQPRPDLAPLPYTQRLQLEGQSAASCRALACMHCSVPCHANPFALHRHCLLLGCWHIHQHHW